MLKLTDSSRNDLLRYVTSQLEIFFPDQKKDVEPLMNCHLNEALRRLETCINAVRMWRLGEFDYLHSSQYSIFLYFLANTIYRHEGTHRVCTKLFGLNKALNGIDCFYEIAMPDIFFIGHSVGIVLAKASYGNYLVMYQNSTVGKNHGISPVLGEGVILYPHSAAIGNCRIANGSVISQGVSVIDQNTPGNCLVFQGSAGSLVFYPRENAAAEYFRIDR
jgi:serine O-acetyltransferase